jgi:hypothetical protein
MYQCVTECSFVTLLVCCAFRFALQVAIAPISHERKNAFRKQRSGAHQEFQLK